MKVFVLFFSLLILWSCEKASSVFDEESIQVADKQSSERLVRDVSLYVVPALHPSEKISIGWDLPSGYHLSSLVIKNEWDGCTVDPGLMEIVPIEVCLPTTGTYSITMSYRGSMDWYTKSVVIYYHYDASNPSASRVVNEVQKPQCSHDFSGLRSYAVMQITKINDSYIANFDISYTGNANYKAVLFDSEGRKLAERSLVNLYPSSNVDTTLSFHLYTVGSFVLKIYSNDCDLQDLCTNYLYINFHNTVIYAMGDIEYFMSSR